MTDTPLTDLLKILFEGKFTRDRILEVMAEEERKVSASQAEILRGAVERRERERQRAERRRAASAAVRGRESPRTVRKSPRPKSGKLSVINGGLVEVEDSERSTTVLNLQVGSTPEVEVREIPSAKPPRSSGTTLPPDWQPKASHYALAQKLDRPREFVDGQAEVMREWAVANANRAVARKANWDLTFNGFLRRDAAKGPRRAPAQKTFADMARDMMERNGEHR